MAINELRALSVFIQAAELGSLRKAAAALNLTPQAASQALMQLERHLDVRLFHRSTRALALTEEGLRLLDEARPALLNLHRALENTRHQKDEIAGPLRITGPRTSFVPMLSSLLAEFCALYPSVQPDVYLDDRVGNWIEERIDVGFRMGVAAHEGVIARPLFPLQLIVCAAPNYLARHGAPRSLADLSAHRCSVFRHPDTGQALPWRFTVNGHLLDHPVSPASFANDEALELQTVLSGLSIGQLSGITAAPYLRSGALLPLLVDLMPDFAQYFIYYGSRQSQPARVRTFIDWTIQRLLGNTEFVLSRQELRQGEQTAHNIARAAR